MPDNEIRETLFRIGAETIGSLGMMLPLSEEEASAAGGSTANQRAAACKIVAVPFSGPSNGVLLLNADERLLPELAGNMLGLEDGVAASREQQEDALKELANVVCGNLLPAIAGKHPVFHIGAPYVVASPAKPAAAPARDGGSAPPWCPMTSAAQTRLQFSGGAIALKLVFKETVVEVNGA